MASKITNLDVKDSANSALVNLGVNLIKKELGTEVAIFDGLVAGLTTGSLSVRGGKATIDEINLVGALPSIAVTSVQYLLASNSVRQLVGGKEQPLKVVIGVATQGSRKFGKPEFLALVATGLTFKALATKVENQPAREKAQSEKTVADMSGFMSQFLGAKELEDLIPSDIEIASEFFAFVDEIKKGIRATHPAVQSKGA